MTSASVVIGAHFGDEGKGQTVDWLASQQDRPTVVRFNGGAQAGHTVQLSDGTRHVFHHFGSGTLREATTHLSKYFVCNPILFDLELGELAKLGISPYVSVDPHALITTPYDMMLNQQAESTRAHGTCGIGFGETIERFESGRAGIPMRVGDFLVNGKFDHSKMKNLLGYIFNEWIAIRNRVLKIDLQKLWYLTSKDVNERFVEDTARFFERIEVIPDEVILNYNDIIFEGAQGLLLDQDNSIFFPHVTRSNTGLHNVNQLLNRIGDDRRIKHLDVYYITRSYLTRHGAGKLPGEGQYHNPVVDQTNQPNIYQGVLRTAPLNLPLFQRAIQWDQTMSPVSNKKHLVVTWMNDSGHGWPFINGRDHYDEVPKIDIPGIFASWVNIDDDDVFISNGKTSESIHHY